MVRKLRSLSALAIVLTLLLSFAPMAFAAPANLTYKEYLSMSTDEQIAFREQFASSAEFKNWYLTAKKAYEDSQNKVVVGDGNSVDLGDILNPAIDSGTCGDNLSWVLSQSGLLTITGTGAMYDYTATDAPWVPYADKIIKIEIPYGITKIGKNAFSGCSSVTDVYYSGTEYNWTFVSIGSGNDILSNVNIHYRQPVLQEISVKTLPTKTVYSIGDTLDRSGLMITLLYNDGSTEDITSGFTLSDLDSATTGIKVITVKYADKTATFNVTVNASPLRIEVATQPAKTTYWVGETLDANGLSLNLIYNDNSVVPVNNGFDVSGFDSGTPGIKEVTVTYQNFTTTFFVTVNAITLTDVEILSTPAKTTFWVGEPLDTTGLVLNLMYSNGESEQIDSCFEISGFDSATAGKKTVTVTYQNFSVDFIVTINEVTLTDIEIISLPNKTQYWLGQPFDPSGLTVKLTYSNGETANITEGFEIDGYDPMTEGIITVTLTYQGFSKDFEVTLTKGGQCGESIFWSIEDTVLILTGSGAMYDYTYGTSPWFAETISSISIDPEVTYIGRYAFAEMDCLTTVEIIDTVTIGAGAFAHCDNLRAFSVSDNHPFYCIDAYGALYNKNMTVLIQVPGAYNSKFTIPVSVTEIGESAFFGCRKLTDIFFSGSTGATGGFIERDETSNNAGTNASNTAYFGNSSISAIGAYAFADCELITSITIPKAVTTINAGTFQNCNNLAKILIHNNVSVIDKNAFTECDALNSVVFDGSKSQWLSITINDGNENLNDANVLWVYEIKFSSAAPGLYNDIAMYYTIDKTVFDAMGATDPYLVVKFNGAETTITDYTVSADGTQYTFGFFNIAPNQMGDTITATLYATYGDGVYEGATLNYSVALYCTRMLNNSAVVNNAAYAELRTLLVDLLNYGAAAQNYTGYKTNSLVNKDLTATQKAWGTSTTPELTSKTAITNRIQSPVAGWKTAILVLDDSVTIRLIFSATDVSGMSMKITTDANPEGWVISQEDFVYDSENNYYYVDFGELHAGQMRQCIYATVYSGDTAVSHTLRYSIESYAASFAANTDYPTVADLVKAMMRYGDAAYNFVN